MTETHEVSHLRVPPHSVESEQSVLGALLLDNRGWDRVGDMLTSDTFYQHRHRLIFAAISGLVVACKPADPITVLEALRYAPDARIDMQDMLSYLEALRSSVPSASNIRRYAEIVADRALERSIIAAADEAAALAFSGSGRASDKLDAISMKFRSLEAKTMRVAPRPLSELIAARLDHINSLHEKDEEAQAWPTPLPALNRLLSGGLRAGRVYVVAARPSVGKSAFAQAIGVRAASNGHPTLFLSQEMPDSELVDRILSQAGRIDFGHLQTGALEDDEWGSLSEAAGRASSLPFYVDDQSALTLGQIRAKARQVQGLRVLIVDYLQLTAGMPTGRGQTPNRNAEIEEVSRGLKSLAKDLGIAVVLLSQLNREVEKRPGKRPVLSDLRDSGAIEQDADVVLLMWPLAYSPVESCQMVGMQLAKNRGGAKGEFPTCFWGKHMRWGEAELPLSDYEKVPGRASGDDL